VHSSLLQRWSRTISALGFAGLCVATVLTLVEAPTPLLSQLVHFQFYLALAWAAWIGIYLIFARHQPRSQIRRGALLTGLIALAWHGHTWAGPWDFSAQPNATPEQTVRLMWANVQQHESHIQNLLELVEQEQPDVIGLGEAVDCDALDQLLAAYPHVILELANGLVLCSRIPWVHTERILVPDSRPIVAGELLWQGRSLHLFAVHALWPTETAHGETCIAAAALSYRRANSLFMGDWNTTPWAPSYRYLLGHSNLQDCRQGRGAWATWSMTQLPLVRLPIDHMFFGGELLVGDFRVGPDFGSDHYPVLVDIGF
jgi:endonuclease/exonuclease/phosphatase (EEP) superfamily protein YafD